MNKIVTILLLLIGAQLSAQAPTGLRPFAEGVTWKFRAGYFNADLASAGLKAMHDIVRCRPIGGHKAGVKTWAFTKNKDGLLLTESYEYVASENIPDEVKTAAPPSASIYRVQEVTAEDVTITSFATNLGGEADEWIHLLPVEPKQGMKWMWKTSEGSFKMGAPDAKAKKDGWNASATIENMDAVAYGDSSVANFTCIEIEVTINDVKSTWWFSSTGGLIRFGGENLGIAREALEVVKPDPETGDPAEFEMDRIVYFRLP